MKKLLAATILSTVIAGSSFAAVQVGEKADAPKSAEAKIEKTEAKSEAKVAKIEKKADKKAMHKKMKHAKKAAKAEAKEDAGAIQ